MNKLNYEEFTWEEWLEINEPGFQAEYERQNATSGFRGGKKGGSHLRCKNGYETNGSNEGVDTPLPESDSFKD